MTDYLFDHIHLNSPDPRKTAEFYEKMFGAKQTSIRELGDGNTIINLNLNGTTILVSQPRDDSMKTGLDHFGIRTDDLGMAIEELKAKGINFTQDETEIQPGFKISFLLAPENVSIELQEGGL